MLCSASGSATINAMRCYADYRHKIFATSKMYRKGELELELELEVELRKRAAEAGSGRAAGLGFV